MNETWLKIGAWYAIAVYAICFLLYPVLIGRPKTGNWGWVDWFRTITGAALVVPMCGRILGWW